MRSTRKAEKGSEEFRRFRSLAKDLLAVPKKEIDRREKVRKKRGRKS